MSPIGVVDDLVVQALEQEVQDRQRISAVRAAAGARERQDGGVGPRQCRFAQIEAGREALHRTADHAMGNLGFHLAFDQHMQFGGRAFGGEGVDDVAEASSCSCSRQSADTSMRQSTTYWPSWLRGVSRSVWITPVGATS